MSRSEYVLTVPGRLVAGAEFVLLPAADAAGYVSIMRLNALGVKVRPGQAPTERGDGAAV